MRFPTKIPQTNRGCHAGEKSATFNLGSQKKPRVLNRMNVLDSIVDIEAVLDEDCAVSPSQDGFIFHLYASENFLSMIEPREYKTLGAIRQIGPFLIHRCKGRGVVGRVLACKEGKTKIWAEMIWTERRDRR